MTDEVVPIEFPLVRCLPYLKGGGPRSGGGIFFRISNYFVISSRHGYAVPPSFRQGGLSSIFNVLIYFYSLNTVNEQETVSYFTVTMTFFSNRVEISVISTV